MGEKKMTKTKVCKFRDCNEEPGFARKGFCAYHYACIQNSKKTPQRIPYKSQKQQKIDREIASIKAKLISRDGMICKGCYRAFQNKDELELSHLIRRSQRPDLIVSINNCTLHGKYCGCHISWDSNDIFQMSKLGDFYKNLHRIKKMDLGRYNYLVLELDRNGINTKHLKIVEIDRNKTIKGPEN